MQIRAATRRIEFILQAVVTGNLSEIEQVSEEELSEAHCHSGCTALHWAAGSNQVAVLNYLLLLSNNHNYWDVNDRVECCSINGKKKPNLRTPLHYACRNGALEAAQCLVHTHGADPNPTARQGVTPFQLAVWQNQLPVCRWLVQDCGIQPANQVNDFGCGAPHWLGICPPSRADDDLLPTAEWLAEQPGISFSAKQKQGHSILHKAAWMGHLTLVSYLHEQHGMMDDATDLAGNYAADLADMAHTPRHDEVARYLRQWCSRQKYESCAVLGVDLDADPQAIREAYKQRVRLVHPDKNAASSADEFDALQTAYRHLTVEQGRGSQSNPAHSLNLMIKVSAADSEASSNDNDLFQARLIAVLLEYGDKGIDLSNLRKKWKQVWPHSSFPEPPTIKNRKMALSKWIRRQAGDVVDMRLDEKGCLRAHAKHCSRATVATAASYIQNHLELNGESH